MTNRLTLLAAAAALAGLMATTGAAEAALSVRAIISGGGPVTVIDNQAGDAAAAIPGFLVANPAGTGASSLALGAVGAPFVPNPLFFGGADATAASGVVLRLEFTQTGVTAGSPGSLLSTFDFELVSGSAAATIASYVSFSNLAFAADTLLFSETFTATGIASADTAIAVSTPYSQTVVLDITFGGAAGGPPGEISMLWSIEPGDLVPVPEPASLALLGAGLLGLGLGLGLARRRRR